MTKIRQIYKCGSCGNIIEIVHPGGGELVCCGQQMELLREKHDDKGEEKHVPVIEEIEGGIRVRVGSIPHPMENEHYIEWIEIVTDGIAHRKFLEPGEEPEAIFSVTTVGSITAREYCSVHGLWQS